MSIPVQTINIQNFAGSHYGANYLTIPDVYGDGINVRMFSAGELRSISGYEKMNATSRTTNGGAAGTRLVNLAGYQKVASGAAVQRILGVFDTGEGGGEYEIWYTSDLGVNWTFLYDAGVTPSTGNAIPCGFSSDFAQFGDTIYITIPNGAGTLGAPKKWDGTTFATAGRTQSPSLTPAAGAAGNLTGNYQWKLLSMIGNARQAGSAASTSLALTAQKGSLTWTADANGSVTGYELYRTTATGSTFYFVAYIDLRVTAAYTDNTTDLTILQNRTMQEHGDAPPLAMFCVPHKQRMIWARTIANPARLYFSDPGLPEDVYAQNYLDFSDTDFDNPGDTINGVVGDYEGQLVVFLDHSISIVSGTGQVINGIVTDWQKNRTGVQIGTGSPKSIVKIPSGALYTDETGAKVRTEKPTLAYISSVGDIRLFDGSRDYVISTPINYWTNLATGFLDVQRRFYNFSCVDHVRSEVTFGIAYSSGALQYWVWNYQWGVWSYLNPAANQMHFSMLEQLQPTSTSKWMFSGGGNTTGPAAGNLYSWTTDYPTFAGSAIQSSWSTKLLYPRDKYGVPVINLTNRWRWLTLIAGQKESSAGDLTMSVSWQSADGMAYDFEDISNYTNYTNSASVVLDDAVNADNITIKLKDTGSQNLYSTGIALRFNTSSSLTKYWFIRGLALNYQPLPGSQRGMQ